MYVLTYTYESNEYTNITERHAQLKYLHFHRVILYTKLAFFPAVKMQGRDECLFKAAMLQSKLIKRIVNFNVQFILYYTILSKFFWNRNNLNSAFICLFSRFQRLFNLFIFNTTCYSYHKYLVKLKTTL